MSIHRAVEASESRAQQGWIQLEEEERELLQQRRRITTTTQSKRATWQLMEPSPTPQAFQFMATTTSTAPPEEALNLSMNLAPSNNSSFEEDQGGNPPTLELFPIRTRDWRAEKGDYEASMASIDTNFVPNQFFEFLPLRN